MPTGRRNRGTHPWLPVRLIYADSLVSCSRIAAHTGHLVGAGAFPNRVSAALSPVVPVYEIYSYKSSHGNLFRAKEVQHEVIPGVVYGGNNYLRLCRGGV